MPEFPVMIIVNPKSNNPLDKFKAIEPPIWCAYLASRYVDHWHGIEILDAEAENLSVEETIQRIGDRPSLFVAMGSNPSVSSTSKMATVDQLCRRRPLSFVAGLHPQALKLSSLLALPSPQELCELTPTWGLMDFSKYRAHNWHCLHNLDSRSGYGVVYTSFGCPFNCDFCNIHAIYNGRKVYYRNPKDVVGEIDLLVNRYGVKNLKICDELFTLNHEHVMAICDGIRDYNLNIWAYARVGTVTPSLLDTMKGAGVNWLAYGFESGNETIRNGVGKNYGGAQETVDITKKAGINIIGNFMFGLPNDTLETMCETLSLASNLHCEWANFYCAMAYPGSKLYKGENKNWDSYNQYGDMGVPKQIQDFRDWAFTRYFNNPRYLGMIREKFGNKAVEHINEMLEFKIIRNPER